MITKGPNHLRGQGVAGKRFALRLKLSTSPKFCEGTKWTKCTILCFHWFRLPYFLRSHKVYASRMISSSSLTSSTCLLSVKPVTAVTVHPKTTCSNCVEFVYLSSPTIQTITNRNNAALWEKVPWQGGPHLSINLSLLLKGVCFLCWFLLVAS